MLDVACGSGRHLQWLAQQGHVVSGVDLNTTAAQQNVPQARLIQADIENGPWPFNEAGGLQKFGAVVATNYLWRPLMSTLLSSVAPGGLFIYETFAVGNETVGRPARPDFLLQPEELLQVCAGFRVIAYENGFLADPDRFVQRIVAFAPALPTTPAGADPRHAL